ncbi:hypothetical protein [Marinobacter halodurans]|nr:hypothetical protein [Marinobacter halodurans]
MLNGGAIKGIISNGEVTAWSLEKNPETGRYETGSALGSPVITDKQGRFQLPIKRKASGWILVELRAKEGTRMTCDVVPSCFVGTANAVAFGETFPLNPDFRLRGAVDLSVSHDIYLTPLSSLAVTQAEGSDQGLSAASLTDAYAGMESAFGLQAGTLQLPPPDLVRLNGFSGSTDAVQLAIINAAFLSLVDGSHWQSIEEVLKESEALIRENGYFSVTPDADGDLSVQSIMLEAAVLSEGLKSEFNSASVVATLDEVSIRTQAYYTEVAGSGSTVDSPDNSSTTTTPTIDQTATLTWDAPLTRMNGDSIAMGELQGYEIVYGHTADTLDNVIVIDSASTTTHTIENLDQGDWYFAVRAIDTEGLVSPLSAVVSKSISG